MMGNWVDLLILIFLSFFVIEGWNKGLATWIFDLGATLISFLMALKFYKIATNLLTANFSLSTGIANALGFLVIGITAEWFFTWIAGIIITYINKKERNKFRSYEGINKSLGAVPAIINGIIFLAFLLTLAVTLPTRGDVKYAILNSRLGAPLVVRTQVIEKQISDIFGDAINETLTFLTIPKESGETVNLHFTTNDHSVDIETEIKMFTLINAERTNRGLKPLAFDQGKLQEAARKHGEDMLNRGYFSHYSPEGYSPFDRMQRSGVKFLAAGENLALAPNVEIAHQGLMNSPGHKANILSTDYGRVGIGVINGGVYGEMFVQEFTN